MSRSNVRLTLHPAETREDVPGSSLSQEKWSWTPLAPATAKRVKTSLLARCRMKNRDRCASRRRRGSLSTPRLTWSAGAASMKAAVDMAVDEQPNSVELVSPAQAVGGSSMNKNGKARSAEGQKQVEGQPAKTDASETQSGRMRLRSRTETRAGWIAPN
jgi:hypothetical protein